MGKKNTKAFYPTKRKVGAGAHCTSKQFNSLILLLLVVVVVVVIV